MFGYWVDSEGRADVKQRDIPGFWTGCSGRELPFLSPGGLGADREGIGCGGAECEVPMRTPCGALGDRCLRGVRLGGQAFPGMDIWESSGWSWLKSCVDRSDPKRPGVSGKRSCGLGTTQTAWGWD